MTIRLSIDRFEGDRKQIAVLLAEDGTAINFPKIMLPKGAGPAIFLTFQIDRLRGDPEPDRGHPQGPGSLKKTDPGGDITL